jgi:hypothetical protein
VCQSGSIRFIHDMVIWESSSRLSFVFKRKLYMLIHTKSKLGVPFCFWIWLLLSIQDCIDYMIEDLVL